MAKKVKSCIIAGIMKRELWTGDNLPILRGLETESVDLIYLDPPFNSKRIYEGNLDEEMGKQSFKDIWRMSDINKDDLWALKAFAPKVYNLINTLAESHGESWQAYLTFMAIRLDEMHRILKPTGSIYLHCDPTMSHGLKLLLDLIFGQTNFHNEIIWYYNNRLMRSGNAFARLSDVIFWYSKSPSYIYHPQTDSKWEASNTQKRRIAQGWEIRKGDLIVYDEKKFARSGINPDEFKTVYWDAKAGQPPVGNVWSDIPIVNPMAKERTGWTTQKPLALLERIIKASSNKGELVLDPFCGCATACVAAERLKRQWIGIDQHPKAAEIMKKRIKNDTKLAPEWEGVKCIDTIRKSRNLPRRSSVREIDKTNMVAKKALYDAQDGKCKSGEWCVFRAGGNVDIEWMEFDRIDPGARGGYYTLANVQLLCRKCNIVKRDMTWTQFINERKDQKAKQITDNKDVPR